MAGVEDEDELRDADDAAATDPPPSSPSASTPSKPKPPAAAAGGLSKRLLAFSATFSAAIGRPSAPSSPKPSSPPAVNVGLGLLLDLGPKPSADGSDASAHDLHLPPGATLQLQDGEEEAREEQGAAAQRAQLALRHEEDQVVGHDVGGVGEELALLVPMEEEDQLIAEGGEKEGVVDGCSVNRNGLSLQDQEKEGEQHTRDELGAAMEDQEVVEKEGATKYYTVVEDQSNDAEEQCTGDAPRAIKDDFTVEDQEVVVQEGATKYCTAVEDQSNDAVEQRTGDAPRTVKDDNTVEDQEVVVQEGATKYCTTVEDQSNNAAEQCTGDAPREVKDDITVEDQEVVVQEGATKYCTAVEDQSNNAAEQRTGDAPRAVKDDITVEDHNNNTVEQCASDTPRAINDDIVLEEKENAMEQEGPVGIVDAAEYGIDVGSREEDVLVEGQDEDGISVQDQHKVMEQCTNDELGVAMGESGVQDQEVMVVEQEGVTKYYDAAVEDQSNNTAVEQCTSDELRAVKDGKVVEEKEEEVEQEGDIVILCAAKDGVAVGSQEQQEEGAVVVADQGEDAISLQNQDKVVEQCTSDQLRPTTDDNSVQDHEVVEKEGAIVERGTTTDVIAVETQEKALEQSAGDESRATKDENAVEDKEKMVDQGVLDKQDAIKDGSAVGSQENEDVVRAEQGEGGISVQDQDKVVEQRTSDQMRTTTCDNAADKYKAVEQEGTIVERCAAADGIAVESQEKAVEQSAGDESRATKDENTVENKEKVVDQEGVIEKQDAFNDGSALGSQDKEDVVIAEQGEGGISVQDQDNSVEQYNLDQLRTAAYNNAVEDYKVVEQESAIVERGATMDGIAVEVHEKAVLQSAGDELRATNDENAVEHKEKVVNLVIIDKQGAIKDGGAVDSQEAEEDVMVAEQGEDGISVQDQDKVVEQCTSDQLRTATGDIDAEDQVVSREKVRLIAGYPQRPGRPNCRFYMSNGGCSYGLSCYYHHPQLKAKPEVPSFPSEQGNREVAEFLELNRVGLPIREGARNCTYFMRNGTCRYGKKCCFNHPEKVLDVQLHMPTGWDDTNLPSSPHLKKSSEHANINDLSSSSEFLPPNILRMLLPPQNVPPATEEKEMKVKKDPDWSSASDDSDGGCSADGSGGPLCKQEHVGYSERPGRQECPFLLRFGNCKFATSCQYYHPKDKFQSRCRPKDKFPSRYHPKDSSLPEERMVYPDKPGEPECPFYMKTGSCKFGAECKFHHPKDLPPSMQAPAIPKRSIAASEHHPTTKTTLQDQMYQQQKYPERPGEPTCRYYMQFGKCKFLSACVFNHPKERLQSEWRPTGPAHSDKSETWQPTNTFGSEDQCQQEQNISGMPECPFYMRTGTCQFGSACQFHHPKHRCSSTEGVIVDGFENAITSQRMF